MQVSRPRLPSQAGSSRSWGLVVGLMTWWATAAQAQSLQALYQAAKSYDATYLSAQAQARSAQYKSAQASALRLPTVGLSADAERTHVNLPPLQIGPITYENPAYNTQKQVALQARQPVFNKGNEAQITEAQRSLSVAQADLEKASQDLMVRVAQAYFDVLAAQDALATARANHKAIREQLAAAKRNFEVGNATVTDSREAQARSDLADSQEIAASNDLRIKLMALESLVGQRGILPKPLDTNQPLPPVTPGDAEQWVTLSENAPDVRKAELAQQIAQLEIDNAKAGHLPTVDLVGTFARVNNSTATLTQPSGSFNNSSVSVEFNMPLFSGFSVQNRIKETEALEEKAGYDLEAARRGLAQAVRTAYYNVESGLAQVHALEAAESSSKLALEATELGYRVGVRVNIDVLNAQTQVYNTLRDLDKARYDVLMGQLKLRQLAGVLKESDIDWVSRLLVK